MPEELKDKCTHKELNRVEEPSSKGSYHGSVVSSTGYITGIIVIINEESVYQCKNCGKRFTVLPK
jgi:hypothetical protein